MKLTRILLLGSILSACGDGASPPTASDQGPFGGTPPTAEEFAVSPKTLPRAVLVPPSGDAQALGTPSSVLLSDLPAARPQGTATRKGSPGSCEIWSAGYVMGSYVANVANGGGPLDASNSVSVGFVYAEVLGVEKKACPKGTAASDALDYLVRVGTQGEGAPAASQVRYEPDCSYIDGISVDQAFQTDLSIGSWSQLPAKADVDEAAESIKEQLQAGLPAQMTLQLPYGFLDYENGTFELSDSCPSGSPQPACAISKSGGFACVADAGTPSGCSQHGIALVGYDDALSAFWIQNSFGKDWGEEGRMWLAYDAFDQIYLAGTIAHVAASVAEATVDAHQAEDPRAGRVGTTHLILRTSLVAPLRIDTITIAPPEGESFTQDFGHWFRTGTLHASRHDGLAWLPGEYAVSIVGRDGEGASVEVEATAEVGALAGREARAAGIESVTGTNGRPVRGTVRDPQRLDQSPAP